MKIGIFIKKPENIFSNGCVQQALFLKKLLSNTGHEVEFLTIENEYNVFEISNDPIIYADDKYDFSDYICLIFVSLVLLHKNNKTYIENLKKYNKPLINLICGNLFILHQEEFVFNHHNIFSNYLQDYITENWVLEMYDYSKDYIKFLTNIPTKITPYVWDIDIIEKYKQMNDLSIDSNNKDRSKVNLLIFEPNMSIHKNALVPLLICEEYYRKNKDKVNKVFIFCGDKVINQSNYGILSTLNLIIDGKIESYGRIIMPYILDVINKQTSYLNIVISYNLLNRLNFLHLELFHLGIPIIHNCEPFKDNEMFFENYNLEDAVHLIEKTRTSFDEVQYKNKCLKIIEHFSSSNTNRCNEYKRLIDGFVKDDDKKTQSIHTVPSFSQGKGYVLCIDTSTQKFLIDLLSLISSKYEKCYCAIFTNVQNIVPPFNNFVDIEIITVNKENVNEEYAIKNCTFKEIYFVPNHSTSPHDFKMYTK